MVCSVELSIDLSRAGEKPLCSLGETDVSIPDVINRFGFSTKAGAFGLTREKGRRSGMVQRLSHEVYETSAERTGCLAEINQRREVGTRMEQLVKLGLASPIVAPQARTNNIAALVERRRALAA